jgi:hypothetical protein
MHRILIVAGLFSLTCAMATLAAPAPGDSAAIFKAAGFKAKIGKQVRCEDDVTMSYQPGRIEMQDLNGDGNAEAWVLESSVFCYGNTAAAFVLLTKGAGGTWTILLDEVGMALVLKTKSKGWFDIEVGGSGAGPFPDYRFDGKKYVRKS